MYFLITPPPIQLKKIIQTYQLQYNSVQLLFRHCQHNMRHIDEGATSPALGEDSDMELEFNNEVQFEGLRKGKLVVR